MMELTYLRLFTQRIQLVLMTSVLIIFHGCYSFKAGQIPKEVKTFSVQFFPNRATIVNPSLSQTFTEKLKLKFNNETSLTRIDRNGDYAFEGFISDYSNTPVAIQGNQTAAQNRLTINISVKFINKLDERQNYETSFSRFVDYSSTINFAAQEQKLMENIVAQIVDDIFNKTTSTW